MCLEPYKPGEMVLNEAGGMNKDQITEGLLSNEKNCGLSLRTMNILVGELSTPDTMWSMGWKWQKWMRGG